jgi:hypothetical protein
MDTMTFEECILADEAKLADYRADIRSHELRIASIRRAMATVEARVSRLKTKAKRAP